MTAYETYHCSYFDDSPDGVFVTDEHGNYLEANPAASEISGYSIQELLSMNIRDIIPSDAVHEAITHSARLKVSGKSVVELNFLHKNGSRRWWSVYAVKLSATRFLGFAKDITLRKRIEETHSFLLQLGLHDIGADFFQVLACFLASTLNIDCVCIARLYEEGAVAHQLAAFRDGELKDCDACVLKDSPCGDVVNRNSCAYPNGVRELFPDCAQLQEMQAESFIGITLVDQSGKPIGLIALAGRQPLTDLHLTESVLKLCAVSAASELQRVLANEILLNRELKLKTILETSSAGIISLLPEGSISFFNNHICEMFGYSTDELNALNYTDLVHPDQRKTCMTSLHGLLSGENEVIQTERLYQRKNGDPFWGYLCARRIMEPDGAVSMLGTITDVSTYKDAEAALLKSSEQLQLAIEASSVGVWDWDLASGDVFWSDSCFTMLGYEPEEFRVTLDKWKALLHPGERNDVADSMMKQISECEGSFSVEFRIATKGGGWRWIQGRGKSALHDENGRILRIVGTHSDIENRKQEQLLLQYKLAIRDMDLTGDGTSFFRFMLDAAEQMTESRISFFHTVESDKQHLPAAQVLSINTLAAMCSENLQQKHSPTGSAGVWAESFHTRQPVIHNDYAGLDRRKGYPELHIPIIRELTVPVIFDDKVVAVIVVGNKDTLYDDDDISYVSRLAHYAYETAERKKAVAMMSESEARYALTLAAINDGMWDWDVASGAAFFSPAFYKMLGYENGDFEASYNSWMGLVHPEEIRTVQEKLRHSIRDGSDFSLEMRMKTKSGQWLWVNARGNVVERDDYGNAKRMVGTLSDISAKKLAEEQVKIIEEQFQQTQKLESLGVLAGGIAHDFNNILTIILGHCYICRDEIRSGQSPGEHIEQIEAAANRAADLCRQMLAYAGKHQLIHTRINLCLFINEVVRMLRSAFSKNVEILLDLDLDVPEIVGDESKIQQVIMNLIINSAEAIGKANGKITVKLGRTMLDTEQTKSGFVGAAVKSGAYASLEITDTGCGMSEEVQKHIFEPFYTTKFAGRGLGMSAILGIVNSHDGAIQLSSRPGYGTTVRVYLPLPAADDMPEEIFTDRIFSNRTVFGSILLVDDEEELLRTGTSLLNSMGYVTKTASNGAEALDIFKSGKIDIDLIILDVNMPGMSGLECCREIRTVSPEVPIIMVSGYSAEQILGDITAYKYMAVIQKPFKPEQLRNAISTLLETPR